MKSFPGIFDGVAFHCYGGSVDKQDQFVQAVPNKDVYFTGAQRTSSVPEY
jgi:O-glycosyl hydrolase